MNSDDRDAPAGGLPGRLACEFGRVVLVVSGGVAFVVADRIVHGELAQLPAALEAGAAVLLAAGGVLLTVARGAAWVAAGRRRRAARTAGAEWAGPRNANEAMLKWYGDGLVVAFWLESLWVAFLAVRHNAAGAPRLVACSAAAAAGVFAAMFLLGLALNRRELARRRRSREKAG